MSGPFQPRDESRAPFCHRHQEVKIERSLKFSRRKYLKFQKVAGNSANRRKNFMPRDLPNSRRNPLHSRISRDTRSTEHLAPSCSRISTTSPSHVTPVTPRTPFTKPAWYRTIRILYREHEFFSPVNIRATLSQFPLCVLCASSSVPSVSLFSYPLPLLYPLSLCILRATEMSSNDNNPAMSSDSQVNQAPLPDESTGGGGGPATSTGVEGDAPPTEVSLEQFQELQTKAAKADENWEKYVRAVADLDNYKKRAARERSDAIKYANEALIEKLLPIVDNFEAALAAANAPQGGSGANIDSLKMGINMIYTQLKSFLTDSGVEEIDAAGKPFDPNLHEAVSQQATEDAPEGQVVQQMRKGYRYRDRLIRPAMVVVAKKP
jgi:molecular chaperone GrpE